MHFLGDLCIHFISLDLRRSLTFSSTPLPCHASFITVKIDILAHFHTVAVVGTGAEVSAGGAAATGC